MKLFTILTILAVTANIASALRAFAVIKNMLDCHERLGINEEDLMVVQDLSEIKGASEYTPGQQCSIYCQSEAYGFTRRGQLKKWFMRKQPRIAKKYNLEKIFQNCKRYATDTCDGPIHLAQCAQQYPLHAGEHNL
ncbi:uncharacterized protein LOC119636786 [Glossina fuscipes]|uniref:Uncharacterized protein LOC119636786 n=2 Tax=Nemorhina TaxID=44051 RepID=A0A9C5YVM5_9MUSC|nr:uncharacterized protein LOC119636786 [Glossina fuscipes]KAI9583301.1 hypothetical protein GQX74_012518 [Glossina fuscipes]